MALETQISAKIVTSIDTSSVDKSIAEIEKKISKVTGSIAKIDIEANTAIAQKQIEQLQATVMKANAK